VSRGSRILAVAAACGTAALGALAAGPAVSAGKGDFHLRLLGTFDTPDYVAQPPGNTHLVYVVQKNGVIQVIKDGQTQPTPLLDISSQVETTGDDGMASMAFDPGYAKNRRFYVDYVQLGGNIEIEAFTASADGLTADPLSGKQVILIRHPDTGEHNGGQLAFGPDHHLYISVGDGGCCHDPFDQAYKLNTLLGKILRIDPKAGGGYTVPKSNPRVGHSGKDQIFAWGFRNPWRLSFDSKTGRLAIGEVGDGSREEIDYATISGARGGNFGWPEYEGFQLDDPTRPGPGPPISPILDYEHGARYVIIGGYVVRDPKLPSLDGDYVYSDGGDGQVRALTPHLSGATNDRLLGVRVPDSASPDRTTSFGEGANGQIFVASYGGGVYRLVESH
jgi:glucose/arabinose dehydrogenase